MYESVEHELLGSDLERLGYESSINVIGNVFRVVSWIPLLISYCDFCNSKCQKIMMIKSELLDTLNEYGYFGPCQQDSNSTKEHSVTKQCSLLQGKKIIIMSCPFKLQYVNISLESCKNTDLTQQMQVGADILYS